MTTGTTATHNITACLDSGDKCRQPFAIFYDAICFGAYRFVCSQHVQGLCPIPFGRIDSAFIGWIVDVPFFAGFVYLGGFLNGGVVFPKNEHGIRVFGKFGQQGKWGSTGICQGGSTSGSVESNTDYLFGSTRRTLCKGFLYSAFEHIDIVLRMLAVLIDGRIAIQAFLPTGVVLHGSGKRFACQCIDYDSACRVATVIESYYKFTIHN